jgi:hypothetical protein
MKANSKPLAMPLNEVTVTIMGNGEKTNYHETFMLNTTINNHFEYNGFTYNIPAEDTGHYLPSFWDFPRKWGMFFEQHKLLAKLIPISRLVKDVSCEIGYLYLEKNADPYEIKAPEGFDFGVFNYNLQKNTTIEGSMKAADKKLRGDKENHTSMLMIVAMIVVGIVAAIVLVTIMTQPQAATQIVQNVTVPTMTPMSP